MQDALNWFPEICRVEAETAYLPQPKKALNASPETAYLPQPMKPLNASPETAYLPQPMKALNASPERLRTIFHLPAAVPFHLINE
jgi:hypothetical protein